MECCPDVSFVTLRSSRWWPFFLAALLANELSRYVTAGQRKPRKGGVSSFNNLEPVDLDSSLLAATGHKTKQQTGSHQGIGFRLGHGGDVDIVQRGV